MLENLLFESLPLFCKVKKHKNTPVCASSLFSRRPRTKEGERGIEKEGEREQEDEIRQCGEGIFDISLQIGRCKIPSYVSCSWLINLN